jgi:hypothetical protein
MTPIKKSSKAAASEHKTHSRSSQAAHSIHRATPVHSVRHAAPAHHARPRSAAEVSAPVPTPVPVASAPAAADFSFAGFTPAPAPTPMGAPVSAPISNQPAASAFSASSFPSPQTFNPAPTAAPAPASDIFSPSIQAPATPNNFASSNTSFLTSRPFTPAPAAPGSKINPATENFAVEDSLDSKKQFFQLMAEKIKEENRNSAAAASASAPQGKASLSDDSAPAGEPATPHRSVGLYRKLAIRFLLLAIVLAACVFYFSFTKLTIYVKPSLEPVNDTLMIDVYGGTQPLQSGKAIRGQITHVDMEESGVYPATGVASNQTLPVSSVKLTNTTSKNQPLVATTRLLTADNRLFRLKNTVNIPAGGSVVAEIYADKAGDAITGATRFTIPGLKADMQTKIYADSIAGAPAAATGGKVITASDISNAKDALNKIMSEKVQANASAQSAGKQVLAVVDPTSAQIEMTAKVNDQKDNFDIKIKNIATFISFDTSEIKHFVQAQFASSSDKVLSDINDSDLSYSLDSYNATDNIATVKVNFSGRLSSSQFNAIDRSKIVNLNESQLNDYLATIKEVASFQLEFFPSFIKKAPNLADRIQIVVRP